MFIQGDQKTGLFGVVDSFAVVNGEKARDTSKEAEFCLEQA